MPPRRQALPPEKRRRVDAVRRWEKKQKSARLCVRCKNPRKKGNAYHCAEHAREAVANVMRWQSKHIVTDRERRRKDSKRRRAREKQHVAVAATRWASEASSVSAVPKRIFTPEQKRGRALAARRWEAKQKAEGRCVTCGSPRKKGNKWHCSRHQEKSARLAAKYRVRNREKVLASLRAYAARRRRKRRAERAAAGNPVQKWRRKAYRSGIRKPTD